MPEVMPQGYPQFRTAEGRLTEYSFACGYIEQKSTNLGQFREEDLYTELYMEHGHYHVRQSDKRPGSTVFRTIWETFTEFADARALFDAQPGQIKGLDNVAD